MNAAPQLTAEQLGEVLGLLRGADTAELKLTVPETQHYGTVRALGIDPLEARIRQVFFFDTPDLSLNAAGVVVRARRIQDAAADTVVKLRPVDPASIHKNLRRDPAFGIEVDAMPGGFVCSASFKARTTNDLVKDTTSGTRPLRKLYSKVQRAFFAEHAPDGIGLDDLAVLGPIPVLKLKLNPSGFGRKLAVELWTYPDGTRILELSTKCPPGEAFQVAAEARAHLASVGVDLSGKQQTKTATALRYFARSLTAGGDSGDGGSGGDSADGNATDGDPTDGLTA
jgi:hypothetical protein